MLGKTHKFILFGVSLGTTLGICSVAMAAEPITLGASLVLGATNLYHTLLPVLVPGAILGGTLGGGALAYRQYARSKQIDTPYIDRIWAEPNERALEAAEIQHAKDKAVDKRASQKERHILEGEGLAALGLWEIERERLNYALETKEREARIAADIKRQSEINAYKLEKLKADEQRERDHEQAKRTIELEHQKAYNEQRLKALEEGKELPSYEQAHSFWYNAGTAVKNTFEGIGIAAKNGSEKLVALVKEKFGHANAEQPETTNETPASVEKAAEPVTATSPIAAINSLDSPESAHLINAFMSQPSVQAAIQDRLSNEQLVTLGKDFQRFVEKNQNNLSAADMEATFAGNSAAVQTAGAQELKAYLGILSGVENSILQPELAASRHV